MSKITDTLHPPIYHVKRPSHLQKKIIEFGWDMPSSAYVAAHIAAMETMPFDGLVFGARYNKIGGGTALINAHLVENVAIGWSQLKDAAEMADAIPFTRFTDNFLYTSLEPGAVDWFDDFDAVLNNYSVAGRFVSTAKLKGIFLDPETGTNKVFKYSAQKYRSTKTFAEYEEQVHRRGMQIMKAIQAATGGLTVFLAFGYDQAAPSRGNEQTITYGLLPAFLDGMLAAAGHGTTFIDGYEDSYGYSTAAQFATAYRTSRLDSAALSAYPSRYKAKYSTGFGLWMDYDSDSVDWQTSGFTGNHFTPAQFQAAVQQAAQRSDRYVWVYTQQPKWWTNENLPAEYVTALAAAKNRI